VKGPSPVPAKIVKNKLTATDVRYIMIPNNFLGYVGKRLTGILIS
jgi:hypothetical protein